MKDLYVDLNHNLTRNACQIIVSLHFLRQIDALLTIWKAIVMMNVWMGCTFGRTAKTVSPTSPRELEATPESLMVTSAPVRWTSDGDVSGALTRQ